jgi:hypothetical protein
MGGKDGGPFEQVSGIYDGRRRRNVIKVRTAFEEGRPMFQWGRDVVVRWAGDDGCGRPRSRRERDRRRTGFGVNHVFVEGDMSG